MQLPQRTVAIVELPLDGAAEILKDFGEKGLAGDDSFAS